VSVKQGGPSHTTTDQPTITADQILTLLEKRKILWKLHLGTSLNLTAPTTGSDVRVQLDGDSDAIVARTLIGPILPAERLVVIFVPPAGYYIIGTIGGGTRLWGLPVAPAIATANGNTTSGTTEILDSGMPLYQFISLPGVRYRAWVDGRQVNGTTAGERGSFAIRDGGQQAPTNASPVWDHNTTFNIGSVAGRPATVNQAPTFQPTAGLHTLGLFIANITGVGTMTPSGRAQMYVEAVGTV
jgi:hypothetical protein